MADYWAMASAVVSAAICIRVLFHQREVHTVLSAALDYLIAAAAGCNALMLLLGAAKGDAGYYASPYSLVLLCVIAYQLFRYRGDATRLFGMGMD